jgi:hypothetical protein
MIARDQYQTGAVMAKALALWQKMGPGGLYENAAAELLSRQQQKNALRAVLQSKPCMQRI